MRPLGRRLVQETHPGSWVWGTGCIADGPPFQGQKAQKEILERTSDPSPERGLEDSQTNRRSREMRSKVKKKG